MPQDDLDIVVRLRGGRQAGADMKHLSAEVLGVARAEDKAAVAGHRLGRASREAERRTRGMHGVMISAGKGVGGMRARVSGLTGALGFGAGLGLIGALNTMKNEARDATLTNKATAAVLHSTGAEAWTSKKHIYDYATALSKVAAVDNQVIQKATNMLLTFRDIRNESGKGNAILDRSTKAALDLSVAFEAAGKSLSPTDAALQLGKAINDPVKGMGRLQRIGVTFTKGQIDQVAKMTKANDTLGAQKVILKELEKEFGGAAKSQADPLKRLGVIYKDLAEQIGLKLMPYINKAATAIGKWVTQVQNGTGAGGRFRTQVEAIWQSAKPVVYWFGRAAKNVFQFASKHPDLVKVAAALFLASKALRLMRFGSAIRGAGLLLGALRKLVQGKFGQKVAGEIASKVGAVPGALGKFSGRFGVVGRLLGTALGVGLVLTLSQKVTDFLNSLGANFHGLPGLDPASVIPFSPTGMPVSAPRSSTPNGPNANRVFNPHGNAPGSLPATPHSGRKTMAGAVPGGGMVAGASLPSAAPGDTVHHTVVHLDGAAVWESWDRHNRKKKNRR